MTNRLTKNTNLTYIPASAGLPGYAGQPARGAYTSWSWQQVCGWVGSEWFQDDDGTWHYGVKPAVQNLTPAELRLRNKQYPNGGWTITGASETWACRYQNVPTYYPAQPYIAPIAPVPPSPAQFNYDFNLGWNAGAVSAGSFEVNGYIQFEVSPSLMGVVAGLQNLNEDAGYRNIEHAFYVANGFARILELGVEKLYVGPVVSTDILKIVRMNGVVTYYVNATLVYTSLTPSSGRAYLDVSLYAGSDYITNPVIAGLSAAAMSFLPMIAYGQETATPAGYNGVNDYLYLEERYTGDVAQSCAMSFEPMTMLGVQFAPGATTFGQAVMSFLPMTMTSNVAELVPPYAIAGMTMVPMTMTAHGFTSAGVARTTVGSTVNPDGTITVVVTGESGSTVTITFPDGITVIVVLDGAGQATVTSPTVQPATGSVVVTTTTPGGVTQTVTTTYNGNGSITVSGTGAAPGAPVTITFPSGSTSTTAAADGTWTATSGAGQPAGTTTVVVSGQGYMSMAPMTMLALGEGAGADNYAQAGMQFEPMIMFAHAYEGNQNASMLSLIGVDESIRYDALVDVVMYSTVTHSIYLETLTLKDAVLVTTVNGQMTMTYSAILQALMRTTVFVSAGVPILTEDGEVWVVNPDTGASTRYEQFSFNSFGKYKGRYLGAKSDGLYLLEGDTDAGSPVRASLSIGKHNLGTTKHKTVPNCYIGLASSGDVFLRVIDGDQTYTYKTVRSTDYLETQRIKLGKGFKANYLTFELYNEAGGDFELNTIEFEAATLQRRIKA